MCDATNVYETTRVGVLEGLDMSFDKGHSDRLIRVPVVMVDVFAGLLVIDGAQSRMTTVLINNNDSWQCRC